MSRTEIERVAVLEQAIITIESSIRFIQGDIKEIKTSLQLQFDLKNEISGLRKEIIDLRDQIFELKKSKNFWMLLSPALAAGAGAILTILVTSYLNNLK